MEAHLDAIIQQAFYLRLSRSRSPSISLNIKHTLFYFLIYFLHFSYKGFITSALLKLFFVFSIKVYYQCIVKIIGFLVIWGVEGEDNIDKSLRKIVWFSK